MRVEHSHQTYKAGQACPPTKLNLLFVIASSSNPPLPAIHFPLTVPSKTFCFVFAPSGTPLFWCFICSLCRRKGKGLTGLHWALLQQEHVVQCVNSGRKALQLLPRCGRLCLAEWGRWGALSICHPLYMFLCICSYFRTGPSLECSFRVVLFFFLATRDSCNHFCLASKF